MAKINIKNDAVPATPPAGYTSLYAKTSDKQLYYKDDTGAEVAIGTVTNEQIQDAVGAILTDTASVDLIYTDGSDTITATVLPAGVDHNSLQNYVANKHIDHTTVTLTAGTGLTGGGDIGANRTFTLADTAVTPAAYGTGKNVATFTVDAQGRLTAAGTTSIKPALSGFICFVEDRTYTVELAAELTKTVSVIITKLDAGTATVALKINGTSVTGCSAISATTIKTTSTATALNAVAVDDTITLVVSASSGASGLSFTLEF